MFGQGLRKTVLATQLNNSMEETERDKERGEKEQGKREHEGERKEEGEKKGEDEVGRGKRRCFLKDTVIVISRLARQT